MHPYAAVSSASHSLLLLGEGTEGCFCKFEGDSSADGELPAGFCQRRMSVNHSRHPGYQLSLPGSHAVPGNSMPALPSEVSFPYPQQLSAILQAPPVPSDESPQLWSAMVPGDVRLKSSKYMVDVTLYTGSWCPCNAASPSFTCKEHASAIATTTSCPHQTVAAMEVLFQMAALPPVTRSSPAVRCFT